MEKVLTYNGYPQYVKQYYLLCFETSIPETGKQIVIILKIWF